MTERKPPDMRWESFAEEQIREAQAAGEFDNLPGFGQPIASLDEPHDEHWWIKAKIRRENISLLPPGLQIAVDVEKALARLWTLLTESDVRREIAALNEHIRTANLSVAWGPPSTTMPLDEETVVSQWRQCRQSNLEDL